MSALLEAFVAALPASEASVAREDPELEDSLREAIVRGTAAYPDITIDEEIVAAHLGNHADESRAPSEWLPVRNVPDVLLACGILHGDGAALDVFERRVVPAMRAAARRLMNDDDLAGEIVAGVREKLVVGTDARGPRIGDYGGHGELVVWARVITIRAALGQLRKQQRLVDIDDHLWEMVSPSADPALALVRRESAVLIKTAFHDGLAALSPRQRNLLRQHLLDGLTIDELGAIYQVHRVTAARWLTAARSDLWSHTRRRLRQTLGLSDSAIGHMLDEIRSTLDLSIERALVK
jgi:RNA polymerase sigma-70 factor (ECF subfamily)